MVVERGMRTGEARAALGEAGRQRVHRGARRGRGIVGIPPGVRRGRQGTTAPAPARTGKVWPSSKSRRAGSPPTVHISPQAPDQLPADVFDEGDGLVVLAEYCGLMRQRDIAVSLEGTALVIAIDRPQGKGVQRVELPCEVTGQPNVSLAKGILKIQVRKMEINQDRGEG